jgi:hypothetical protein
MAPKLDEEDEQFWQDRLANFKTWHRLQMLAEAAGGDIYQAPADVKEEEIEPTFEQPASKSKPTQKEKDNKSIGVPTSKSRPMRPGPYVTSPSAPVPSPKAVTLRPSSAPSGRHVALSQVREPSAPPAPALLATRRPPPNTPAALRTQAAKPLTATVCEAAGPGSEVFICKRWNDFRGCMEIGDVCPRGLAHCCDIFVKAEDGSMTGCGSRDHSRLQHLANEGAFGAVAWSQEAE